MTRQSTIRNVLERSQRWLAVLSVATSVALSGFGRTARADEGFSCELTERGELAETDARIAAKLICHELRRASGERGDYAIRLATLGSIVFVTATRREPTASVTVRVDALEEVPVAAERIAEALVRGAPFTSTQRVDNLLESETQPALSRKGSLKFLMGVAHVESPGYGARAAGFSVGILYAAPRFSLPAELRFAWDTYSDSDPGLSLFSLSLGGRAYLSKRGTSPFAGGGLGLLRLHAYEYSAYWDDPSRYFDAQRFGVAPYLEAGVEMLRLHRARVALGVRVDLPTGSLKSDQFPNYWDETVPPAESRYVAPVSIGLSVAF